MEKKIYVFVAGKHIGPDGKKYVKGDKIELTQDEAKGLVNKIVDPEATLGISVDPNTSNLEAENARLREKVAELELEVEQLKEAMEAED